MRHLRMLTNAIAGGLLGAAYLAVLVLQLNPQVPTGSVTAARWFGTLVMFYGLYLSAGIYLLLLIRDLLAIRPLSPGWGSVRLLAWCGAFEAGLAAVLTWANLKGFRALLSEAAADRMSQGAVATTICAAVLLIVAVVRYSFGKRGTRPAAAVMVASMALSVAMPLWLRGPGEPPVPSPRGPSRPPRSATAVGMPGSPRVRLLAVEGATLRFIRQRVAAGQLPNFGTLLDRGAVIDLATLKPTQSETVWAAAATGKYPPKNGVRSRLRRIRADDVNPVDLLPDYCFAQALVAQNLVVDEDFTASALRARPMWDILSDPEFAVGSGVVNWPLSYPAHAVRGYTISDQFDESESYPLRLAQAGAPTTAMAIAREAFDEWQGRPWQQVLPPSPADEPEPAGLRRARWDRAYTVAAENLERAFPVRMTAIRYEALDVFGHAALREAEPELFGQIARGDPHRSLLDRYYAVIDLQIGSLVDDLAPGDLLLVVSGFGMDRESWLKQLVARVRGEGDRPGSHDRAPDGFLVAFGSQVAPNASLPRGAIVDIAPTVLYYLGVPVGRDMDGFPRVDLFLRSYTVEHPVTYVATHER